jgi:hypothetical protein
VYDLISDMKTILDFVFGVALGRLFFGIFCGIVKILFEF